MKLLYYGSPEKYRRNRKNTEASERTKKFYRILHTFCIFYRVYHLQKSRNVIELTCSKCTDFLHLQRVNVLSFSGRICFPERARRVFPRHPLRTPRITRKGAMPMDKCFFSWNIGENQPLSRFFGCHPQEDGVVFRVCAPEAAEAFVTGTPEWLKKSLSPALSASGIHSKIP